MTLNSTQLEAKIAMLESLIDNNQQGIDTSWLIITGIGIIFMQTGFAMLEAGTVRAKNAKSILMKNVCDATFGALLWYICGYGIYRGNDPYFSGVDPETGLNYFFIGSEQVANYANFFQQYGFAVTTATIVSGGVASRMKFDSYILFSLYNVAIIYPVVAHWGWSEGGWLGAMGFLDFAGSGIVHLTGGIGAFFGALLVGPRYGKFVKDEYTNKWIVRELPGHSATLFVLGSMILFMGWFSFNAGSTGGLANEIALEYAPTAAINTLLSATAASALAILYGIFVRRTYSVYLACNGLLSGLVAITGPCAYVEPWAAIVIGLLATLTYLSTHWIMLNKFHIDDPLDAFAVHGMCGALGIVTIGFFHNKDGLFYAGPDLLVSQLVGLGVICAWTSVTSVVMFVLLRYTIGIRVGEDDQILGIDFKYHAGFAYPDFDIQSVTEYNRTKLLKRQKQLHDSERMSFADSEVGAEGYSQISPGSSLNGSAHGGRFGKAFRKGGSHRKNRKGSEDLGSFQGSEAGSEV